VSQRLAPVGYVDIGHLLGQARWTFDLAHNRRRTGLDGLRDIVVPVHSLAHISDKDVAGLDLARVGG